MTDLRKAAEMALEALRIQGTPLRLAALSKRTAAIDALRAALEQPEPDDYDWAGRWVLREVFFGDDGDPIAHREPQQARRAALNEVHQALQDEARGGHGGSQQITHAETITALMRPGAEVPCASVSYVESDAETYGFEEPKP